MEEHILNIDAQNIWHPYAAPGTKNFLIEKTSGIYLTLETGEQVIDAMSSWWSAVHGHGHQELMAAAQKQIAQMSHVMFGGLTHQPAITLTQKLLDLTEHQLPHVFYSDSGSVAVEVAIKMALQNARGSGHPERNKLLTWRSGYHGDTFAAMSVCDPDNGMHSLWQGTLAEQIFAPPPPPCGTDEQARRAYLNSFEALFDDSIAAVIVEPLVQGAGGMRFHDIELLQGIKELCLKYDRLLIADEIATGFGRTGNLFATLSNGITPDILCLGKALSGGFMSFAATLCTAEVAQAISSPAGGGALMHGPTFMANPLACAVSAASMDIIATGAWNDQVKRLESELEAGLAPLKSLAGVADVRVCGAIGVVEMGTSVPMEASTRAALEQGVWIRPFGRLIYVMPPYITTTKECETICRGVSAAVKIASTYQGG
ncbi:adenosylmethionine--8-amino-7-oxononanoate transaminase [Corynebacterium callunae]|uniref:adenosylmethionine--8-amino-7-oxononanoate transaminase n=1 Tax=Corynebacterium callunae TaxID=1721 RepID=UPI003981D235